MDIAYYIPTPNQTFPKYILKYIRPIYLGFYQRKSIRKPQKKTMLMYDFKSKAILKRKRNWLLPIAPSKKFFF